MNASLGMSIGDGIATGMIILCITAWNIFKHSKWWVE